MCIYIYITILPYMILGYFTMSCILLYFTVSGLFAVIFHYFHGTWEVYIELVIQPKQIEP